ncbi:hypothetical protein LTR46_010671 [Exophiala xenobiotica]|nr:hypothetical protein LTR46_010671 [Exophiala xenobiotica]
MCTYIEHTSWKSKVEQITPDAAYLTDDQHGNHNEVPLPGKEYFQVDAKSCSSVSSACFGEAVLSEQPNFQPITTFYVAAKGIGIVRFPIPSSELEISIYHNDRTLAYMSTRGKCSSGDAVLSHPKLGDLDSTTYFFGPGRDPVMKLLQGPYEAESDKNILKIQGKWTSHSVAFWSPEGRLFQWGYCCRKEANMGKVKLMVLRLKEPSTMEDGREGRVLAQLIRSDETRTQGSSKSSAGNGGQLMLDEHATEYLDEALIVATCLVMLKKEIDRRRFAQFAVLGGIAAGGL